MRKPLCLERDLHKQSHGEWRVDGGVCLGKERRWGNKPGIMAAMWREGSVTQLRTRKHGLYFQQLEREMKTEYLLHL